MPDRRTKWVEEILVTPASRRARIGALALALVLLVGIGVADYFIAYQVSLAALYLAPIFLACWRVGRTAGIATAVASAALITAGDLLGGLPVSPWLIPAAMMVLRTALFLAFVFLLFLLFGALEREHAQARTDELTGVPNRRHFVELVTSDLFFARRYSRPMSVAYVDLDNFKDVNDRHGHPAGDELLRTVARTIRARLRFTDVVARVGGDEFAICLPETGSEAAALVMESVRQDVAAALPEACRFVTLSVGVVTFNRPPNSVDELLQRSDFLLYAAKREGRNRLIHEVVPA